MVKTLLLLCATLTVLAGAIIAPSLPEIQSHFSSAPGANWKVPLILTITGLAIAIASPIAGILAEWIWRAPFGIYLASLCFIPFIAMKLSDSPQSTAPNSPDQPLLPESINYGQVIRIYGLCFFGMVLFYLIPVHFPFLAKSLVAATPPQIGMGIGIATLFSAGAGLAYSRIPRHLDVLSVYILSFALMGLAYFLLGYAQGWTMILIALAFSGIGTGLLIPNASVEMADAAPIKLRGRLMGGLSSSLFLGQFASPLLIQSPLKHYGYSGWPGAYTIAAASAIVVAVGVLLPIKLLGSKE